MVIIQIDTTPPADPVVTVDPITADNAINAAEAGGTVAVTGSVTGASDGDPVVVTVNGMTFNGTVTGGMFSVDVPGSELEQDTSVEIAVTTSDAAGNTATGSETQTYTVDTTPPVAPTVDPLTTNNTTPTITGTAEPGSTVEVTIGGATYQTTATNPGGTFSINTQTAMPISGTFMPNEKV